MVGTQILDTNRALYFRLQQQKLIEFIRQGKVGEALEFAQDELAPRGEESPEFLSELERTMALLAFDTGGAVPSGIAELLSPGQRMKTAGEVNAAILESLSQGTEAKLVKVLRVLEWGEGLLSERASFPKVGREGLGGDGTWSLMFWMDIGGLERPSWGECGGWNGSRVVCGRIYMYLLRVYKILRKRKRKRST
jgi:hypothetical protein